MFGGFQGAYVSVFTAGLIASKAVDFLWPAVRVLDVPVSTVILAAAVGLMLLAWAADVGQPTWDGTARAFLLAVLLAWAVNVYMSVAHEDVLDAAVVLLPVVVALVSWKRPSAASLARALDVLAWSSIALILGVLAAQEVGLLDIAQAGAPTVFAPDSYWLPLSGPFRIDLRWIGPFRSPNVTSSIAAFLIVYCASRRTSLRLAGCGTGILVLLLTGTRSSAFAAVAGIVVLVLFAPRSRILGLPKRTVAVLAVAGLLASVAYWVARNPTLSGRVTAWDDFLSLWWAEPISGEGDRGIGLALEQGRITDQLPHAHSIWIDVLARDGAVALAAVIACVALALVLTIRAARRHQPTGLAVLVTLLVGGITETLFDWRYAGHQVVIMIAAVLLSAAYLDDNLVDIAPAGQGEAAGASTRQAH